MAQPVNGTGRRPLSRTLAVLGWLAMAVFAFHACTHMVGAGDTWVAMACGRHFVNHGVDTVEPFSANSHRAGPTAEDIEQWPQPAKWLAQKAGIEAVKFWHPTGWINQNWLTHVLFYWLAERSPIADAEGLSFNSLVYWKFAVYVLAVICVYFTGRLLGAAPLLSAAFSCAAMFTARSFLDIRPAGFSNLLVAVFVLILVLTQYRNIFYIWLVVPLSVLWCNLHGGYIYLFIMLVPFAAAHSLTGFFPERLVSIGWRGVKHTALAGLVSLAAVVVFNPFHLTNLTHTFLISVSEHARTWRAVNEWHPAFEWDNPVGTGFPFLVLFMLGLAIPVLWLMAALMFPRKTIAPINQLETQRRVFDRLLCVFEYTAAVFTAWILFTSLSFINLDPVSFMVCGLFAIIVVLAVRRNIHFIYAAAVLSFVAVWLSDPDTGYHGRYIYSFCLVPAYVAAAMVFAPPGGKAGTRPKNILHVFLAAVGAIFTVTFFLNPFQLQPPYWDVTQLFALQRLWRPAYEGARPLGYSLLFGVVYSVNAAAVAAWLLVASLRRRSGAGPDRVLAVCEQAYDPRRLDPAIVIVAALTVYMALKSRRFIPIAAFVGCPVMAMMADHAWRSLTAARNFHFRGIAALNIPRFAARAAFAAFAALVVAVLGLWWSARFKSVYLDPWPTDTRLTSVFMRMTASDAKPFDAGRFIRENALSGKMFNYWTEGGFIAWAQQPDQATGRIPLQLFMDGRAQAAYEPEAFETWSYIISGGPIVRAAAVRRQRMTVDDYRSLGSWLDEQLSLFDVWVVLMPVSEFDGVFVRGLESNPAWRTVFLNNKQKLMVRLDPGRADAPGNRLIEGIFTGQTVYPSRFSRLLSMAHNAFAQAGEDSADLAAGALDLAVEAFELEPSQFAMKEIVSATRFAQLRPRVDELCRDYLWRMAQNTDLYASQDGYHEKLVAAMLAAEYLGKIAELDRKTELSQNYRKLGVLYSLQRRRLLNSKRW